MVPALAPLFAMMTTHVVGERFRAAEALSFYKEHLSQLPEVLLTHPLTLSLSFEPLRDPDVYWSLLAPQDRQRWQLYRVPPRSLGQRFLARVVESDLGWTLVRAVRRMLNV